jgi:hypothetical protein
MEIPNVFSLRICMCIVFFSNSIIACKSVEQPAGSSNRHVCSLFPLSIPFPHPSLRTRPPNRGRRRHRQGRRRRQGERLSGQGQGRRGDGGLGRVARTRTLSHARAHARAHTRVRTLCHHTYATRPRMRERFLSLPIYLSPSLSLSLRPPSLSHGWEGSKKPRRLVLAACLLLLVCCLLSAHGWYWLSVAPPQLSPHPSAHPLFRAHKHARALPHTRSQSASSVVRPPSLRRVHL